MSEPVVIVGAGQAGFETATSLRSKGYTGDITILGDEENVPYQRPPLSKAYLKGDSDPESVALRPRDYFASHRIDLHCSRRVTDIDRQMHEVELDDGSRVGYGHLVLATGTRNRALPVPGAGLAGVQYLRTLSEAQTLAATLPSCTSIVVIGGGFIGLEVAAAARTRGVTTTIVESLDRPMARAVSETVSKFFVDEHARHEVQWRLNTSVTEIVEKNGRAGGVRIATGEVIDADIIVVGIGVMPNTELAERAGLAVDNGIVVDLHLLTEDPAISAIGDCASYPNTAGTGRLRLESIQNAVDHARCVANRLVGNDLPYQSVPWFWTEQYASKLQMAGLVTGYDNTVVRGSLEEGAFSVFCFAGDRLLGVESVNRTRDHMAARKLLAAGKSLSRDECADPAVDLKALALA
ncbi:3-phenylpropionate/trans-cinnamate dioxygenase ferredoxin reductase subunit [Rhodococcus pyridinivorans]|uniref:NAD(P)/FAD-dependent oxidoreductase n=1 Tax=Rhodococcus pyridinivorans TaxID=103816 RepID=UPI0007CD9571|nr:FAD-dependent oxidoreductase [Rhodococcus pyridinivorans]KLL95930.1 pyridine nucleotide-disulfide oxidoreductase [Rhodococcus sp. IITR03]SEB91761.1 3-phenylpropionate/trans-cinnamate dioxygenase ferredoxin reductase subunit [Rhodococcus pyridinivorans]